MIQENFFVSGPCHAGRITLIYHYNLADRGIVYALNDILYGRIGGKEKIGAETIQPMRKRCACLLCHDPVCRIFF